ncbi:MAG: hypothetical protein IPG17_33065 [Sandaracinaceae bacterium]|nr:hypothetical protein [Sandaracinaceae bacterium]
MFRFRGVGTLLIDPIDEALLVGLAHLTGGVGPGLTLVVGDRAVEEAVVAVDLLAEVRAGLALCAGEGLGADLHAHRAVTLVGGGIGGLDGGALGGLGRVYLTDGGGLVAEEGGLGAFQWTRRCSPRRR